VGPTILQTARLRVREWTSDDVEDLIVLQSDPEVMRFLGPIASDPVQLRDESEEWIDRQIRIQAGWGWCRWALELREQGGGSPTGAIGFTGPGCGFAPDVEIGWTLRRELWHQGLATEAAIAVVSHCFSVIGFPQLVSCIDPANSASLRVASKVGFIPLDEIEHDGALLIRHQLLNPDPQPPIDPRYRRTCAGAPPRPAARTGV
jgi:ribosomal-protein-alanine N-acetyltransferase